MLRHDNTAHDDVLGEQKHRERRDPWFLKSAAAAPIFPFVPDESLVVFKDMTSVYEEEDATVDVSTYEA